MENSQFLQTAFSALQTSFAITNEEGRVTAHTPEFPHQIHEEEHNLVGLNLFDILPEFVGMETELDELIVGSIPFLRLENINRTNAEGNTKYVTLTIVAKEAVKKTELLVLATNVTMQGEYIQELSQRRNELWLTRRRLANLSYQLDYLVRHFLSPEVTDAFLNGDLTLELGGELQEVSILFADVRSFTPLSEKVPPKRLVQILNAHLNVTAGAIEEFNGTITQFQGDNVIAIFNIFGDEPEHPLNAIKAGIAIQRSIADYHNNQPPGETRLNFGVGINTGVVLIGNIGARQRFSYTATGSDVNLAARITDITPANEVWISQTTLAKLPAEISVEPIPPVLLKGKLKPSKLFRVLFS